MKAKGSPPEGRVRWYAHGDYRGEQWFCGRCDMFVEDDGRGCPGGHNGDNQDRLKAKHKPPYAVIGSADGDPKGRGIAWRPVGAMNRFGGR